MRWETIGVFTGVALCIVIIYYKQREGFENPQTVTNTQQGDIETLRKQIMQFTLSEESLNVLQGEVKKISDQTTTLQNNMPDGQVTKYSK